ncbi:hypothetical protein [Polaribacter sp. Z022]|uniref:tetratricopeptide repeat protein n=1 Tax=Polaribacter sp. Z022 TaxID=2927125 RepID=UPI0020226E11|nr:hypothetical protein [Polaribacter sp. Z022]MCL7753453.1 hypothetical protein [Polaribacter sp. Z022]
MKKIFFLLILLVITSCGNDKVKTNKKEIGFKEVEKLGYDLQEAYVYEDIEGINLLYDKYSLAKRFLIKTSKKNVFEFNKGFYIGFSRDFNFGKILNEEKKNGSSYEFVKFYKDDDSKYHLLFRFFGDNGINYHDHLVNSINNEAKIIDTYNFTSGENISDSYRTIYKSALYGSNFLTNDINKSRFVKDMAKLKRIQKLNSLGKYDKALKLYQSISNTSKQEKIYKLINISISSNISLEQYEKALKDYEDKYPNDPSIQLISIDKYIIKKEYDKSLNAINKLDSLVKGDTFLNYMRANVYVLKKDFTSAIENYEFIKREYPQFIDSYDSLLALYIERKNNNKALDILKTINSNFEVSKEEIKTNLKQNYPNFYRVKEVQHWFNI